MTCHEFRSLHLDYTDGTLGPAELAAAQAHVDACAECARFDCRVRRGAIIVRNLPSITPRPGFYARLAVRLAAESDARQRQRRAVRRAVAGAAASIVLAAGAFVLVPPREPAAEIAPATSAAATPAAVRAIRPGMMMRRDPMVAANGGLPLWSAATLPDGAPVRFASAQPLPFSLSR